MDLKNSWGKDMPKKFFSKKNYDNYMIGLNEFFRVEKDDENPVLKDAILEEVIALVLLKGDTSTLRICSIGCGDGALDKLILKDILCKYPNISIEYVGVEIEASRCREAEEQLTFPGDNVKVVVYEQDFMKDFHENLFDLVLAVHSFYYIKCPEGIKKMKDMKTKRGTIFLAICREDMLFKPYSLFIKNEGTTDLNFSSFILEAFKKANISITETKNFTSDINLTDAVENNFSTIEQNCLLGFLCSSTTDFLDDATKVKVINFYKMESKEKNGKVIIETYSDYYIVRGE